MSYMCAICGKKAVSGKTISHSHRATLRKFSPNLQKIKVKLSKKTSREYVCTRCIKSGRAKKA